MAQAWGHQRPFSTGRGRPRRSGSWVEKQQTHFQPKQVPRPCGPPPAEGLAPGGFPSSQEPPERGHGEGRQGSVQKWHTHTHTQTQTHTNTHMHTHTHTPLNACAVGVCTAYTDHATFPASDSHPLWKNVVSDVLGPRSLRDCRDTLPPGREQEKRKRHSGSKSRQQCL